MPQFAHAVAVPLCCILVKLARPATVTQELTTFAVHEGQCFPEHPHHPTADRLVALKQTAVTVLCYPVSRVVSHLALASRGGHAGGGPGDWRLLVSSRMRPTKASVIHGHS
jgi:hypothetical protein